MPPGTAKRSRQTTPSRYVERVNLAIDHIVAHLAEPLRLADLARATHLSPFHFHRVFQSLVGATPADFVKRLRLDRSLVMMAHDARLPSLTFIALACGFNSSSDFSRSFKDRFKVAPSQFDVAAWRDAHAADLRATLPDTTRDLHLAKLPVSQNPDNFAVRLRHLPARTVAYIRVANPYKGAGITNSAARLVAWAERHGVADGRWLGYQWENPEITSLEQCQYHVAVEAEFFTPRGEIGRHAFPAMTVAEIEIRGPIDLELRAFQYLYGTWLPRSRHVPADLPCFESWLGRPFAHGLEHFELRAQLPVRRA